MGSRNSESPLAKFAAAASHRFQPKLRVHEEEIKKYAASAMNELLSWYGYEKVDEREAQGLQLRAPQPGVAAAVAAAAASAAPAPASARKRAKLERMALARTRTKTPPSDSSDSDDADRLRPITPTGDEEEESSAAPTAGGSGGGAGCAWCGGKEGAGAGGFCSERCFAQCRRATFKRSRLCDWCKAARRPLAAHANELHDAETQLQFCSEKCLNQCKMSIFCKEAAAHLQGGLVLGETASGSGTGGGALITPDLWLKNCKADSDDDDASSPINGPPSPRSPSPGPRVSKLSPKPPSPFKSKATPKRVQKEEVNRTWSVPPPEPRLVQPPPLPDSIGQLRGPLVPPVTVMVPFPVPLPIPIPIPIVIPLFALPPMRPKSPSPAPPTPPPPPPPPPPQQEARVPRKKRKMA